MLTLQEVKSFMRIEHGEEDTFLSSLLLVTENYIKNATHSNADNNTPEFKFAQCFLCLHWYENRDLSGKAVNMPHHLNALFLQITATSGDAL
ncbi:head-tail connector protein [Peribacillus frigoritolerans]|uniref:head-tail connector protein n=1 Tax=Peribacillus frigoritolerans TaxID=450367 RepID=UPI002079C480|nr:head-tail connector protein [Peribacillus frigoritolerans]USK78961.1 head-tail connector protein [Peribacillus frigoritolerans]